MVLNRFLFILRGARIGPEGSGLTPGLGVGVASGEALFATPTRTSRIWVLASLTIVSTVGEALKGVGCGGGGRKRGGGQEEELQPEELQHLQGMWPRSK